MYTKISHLAMAFLLSAILVTAQPTLQQITPQYGETNAELLPEIVFVTAGGEAIVPTSVHERSPYPDSVDILPTIQVVPKDFFDTVDENQLNSFSIEGRCFLRGIDTLVFLPDPTELLTRNTWYTNARYRIRWVLGDVY